MLGISQITTNQARTTTLAAIAGVANPAGSGAGASVSVPLTFTDQYGTGLLPVGNGVQNYSVQVTPSQACFASVAPSSKSSSGFTVTLTPTASGVTLAAGTFDVTVTG
jgi:hypothetical protein